MKIATSPTPDAMLFMLVSYLACLAWVFVSITVTWKLRHSNGQRPLIHAIFVLSLFNLAEALTFAYQAVQVEDVINNLNLVLPSYAVRVMLLLQSGVVYMLGRRVWRR